MKKMILPQSLKNGDKIAIVSLSSGVLGENYCKHSVEIGKRRLQKFGLEPIFMPNSLKGVEYLKNHPEKRAEDLCLAFADESIKGILCSIGGDDTYRTLPYLLENEVFCKNVLRYPKIFCGFSDTTINHLMFYKLGMITFYGPSFLCDLAELSNKMLPYTKESFEQLFKIGQFNKIESSEIWYEERGDFSLSSIGQERTVHKEEHGFEFLQGSRTFQGILLGGCLESLYDLLTGNRYHDEYEICNKYSLFPNADEWGDKVLFLETSESKPTPEKLRKELFEIKKRGVFDRVRGIIIGKPQDEMYYEEYKQVYIEVVDNESLPIMYNLNFGHAYPRTILGYGMHVTVKNNKIIYN